VQVNIEVTEEEGGAIHGAGGPCGAEIIHPHGVAGGDVHSHHKEAPASGEELEHQEVRGEDAHVLHLKPVMILLPEESDPSLPDGLGVVRRPGRGSQCGRASPDARLESMFPWKSNQDMSALSSPRSRMFFEAHRMPT
jgi:hypothetical protein